MTDYRVAAVEANRGSGNGSNREVHVAGAFECVSRYGGRFDSWLHLVSGSRGKSTKRCLSVSGWRPPAPRNLQQASETAWIGRAEQDHVSAV